MTNDKYDELLKSIPSTLKMRLDNIKSYLYFNRGEQRLGSASLMVGFGFSKNADKGVDVAMLDWNELGKKFYTKLYGKEPKSEDLMYSSPIKLATMVEAEFGRTILDKMIQESLPDDRVFPNDLYRDLLNLPWHDVFTTNYDRLLERTEMVEGMIRHYHTVTNKETLIYTPSPRIVKLHGSFPDIHPYIITEEDFRTYPQKYPEFVNTVRQSLIENLFCLIGFSGDDPNFLRWIGWLRDVMGRLSMPVYLITFDSNIHGAQLQLFQRRNIQVVNLADVLGIKTYREAFEFLFAYLKEEENNSKLWNCSLKYSLNSEEDIKKFIEAACRIRKTYPNWLILPEEYYKYFDESIASYEIHNCLKDISDKTLRINLLFEFDWQLTISLTPKRFDWYIEELEKIRLTENEETTLLKKKLWLMISLLGIYRHTGDSQKYMTLKDIIKPLLVDNSDELAARYYNEVSLYYMSELKYDETLQFVQDWQPARTDFKSRIQRATIISECGQDKEAVIELKKVMADINTQKLSNNSSQSPLLDSCKQQVTNLLCIYDFKSYFRESRPKVKKVIGFQSFVNNLKEKAIEPYKEEHGFGINTHTSHWNLGGGEFVSDYLNAYRLLTWFEESGYPFGHYIVSTEEKAMTAAISKIIGYEPFYAVSALVRSCNNKVLKSTLTRASISDIDRETINKIFNTYLSWTWQLKKEYNKSRLQREYFCIKMFSRLCIKAKEEYVAATYNLLIDNVVRVGLDYEQNDYNDVFNCLSNSSIQELIPSLYTIPYFDKDRLSIELPVLENKNFSIEEEIIQFIKDGLTNNDKVISNQAYKRTYCVYKNLTENQKTELRGYIVKWRNVSTQSNLMLESYHLFPYSPDEAINIVEKINKEIDELDVSNYTIDGRSSEPISSFNYVICKLLPVISMADDAHKDKMLHKLCDYLRANEDVLKHDDSQQLMGGLRRIARKLIYNIGGIVSNGGIDTYNKDTIEELYPVLKEYAKIGFHNKSVLSRLAKRIDKLNDLASIVIRKLFTGTVSGTIDNLSALLQIISVNFDSGLMTKVESYIEFSDREDVPSYINFIKALIRDGIYPLKADVDNGSKAKQTESRTGELNALLMNLRNKVVTSSNVTLIADIEYETLRLVQQLVSKYPEWKDSESVKAWKAINDDENTFNDARIKE